MMIRTLHSDADMRMLGRQLGRLFQGGEVVELIGDVGAGKTTLTKGIAEGLEIREPIQSPTFTISRIYDTPNGMELRHYDFYRLNEAGVMADELAEATGQPHAITVVEWGDVVADVLPRDRLGVRIQVQADDSRQVVLEAHGARATQILEALL